MGGVGIVPARDYEQVAERSRSRRWLVSWHPLEDPPPGRPNGAAGVCVSGDGCVVLVSRDGDGWTLPAGRPEPGETDADTLRRELREEACVEVRDAQLLGFTRSECVEGRELGAVLVRSWWRAGVEVQPWRPEFEIAHRRLVPAGAALAELHDPDPAAHRMSLRALVEAGLR